MMIFFTNPSFGLWDDPNGEDRQRPPVSGTISNLDPRITDDHGFFCPLCYVNGKYTWLEYDQFAKFSEEDRNKILPPDYLRKDECYVHGIIDFTDTVIKKNIIETNIDIKKRKRSFPTQDESYLFNSKQEIACSKV